MCKGKVAFFHSLSSVERRFLEYQSSGEYWDFIKSIDDFTVWACVADKNEEVRQACCDDRLAEHWESILRDPAKLTHWLPYKMESGLLPQSRVSNFELLAGLYYYSKGSCLYYQEGDETGLADLEKAAKKYHSFYPLLARNKIFLAEVGQAVLQQKPVCAEFLQQIIADLANLIPYHGAPIYVQLAFTLYYFVSCGVSPSENLSKKDLMSLGLQYLYVAQRLQETCEVELHNAYFGRGFKAGNPLNFETIDQAVTVYEEQALPCLQLSDFDLIRNRAIQEANRFSESISTSTVLQG